MKNEYRLQELDIDKEGIFDADKREGYPRTKSDKNTLHSYLETYELLMYPIKETAKNIVEIGIWEGGSIKLWNDYFLNAEIIGIDLAPKNERYVLEDHSRIHPIFETDAYNIQLWTEHHLFKDCQFDVIIDDGPHTPQSQIWSARNLNRFLNNDEGIFIIEDVPNIRFAYELKLHFPPDKQRDVHIVDLIDERDRYDNILMIYDKNFNDKQPN